MTFTSVLITAVAMLSLAGLAVLCGAALLVAVADLSGHDLIPARTASRGEAGS